MTEPFHIAQTAEPDHLADPQAWFKEQGRKAYADGGIWQRYTIDRLDSPARRLLFECWKERPDDPGDIRWMDEA
jgi:hypothetical protein